MQFLLHWRSSPNVSIDVGWRCASSIFTGLFGLGQHTLPFPKTNNNLQNLLKRTQKTIFLKATCTVFPFSWWKQCFILLSKTVIRILFSSSYLEPSYIEAVPHCAFPILSALAITARYPRINFSLFKFI